MFKFKKIRIRQDDITKDYNEPGSYLGVIFSHKDGGTYWKIIRYYEENGYYKRCKVTYHKYELDDIVEEPFQYTHQEIKGHIANNSWKIINY